MSLQLPDTIDELEEVADLLGALLDSIATGAVDGGPLLERLIIRVLDEVEAGIQRRLQTADTALSRETLIAGAGGAG